MLQASKVENKTHKVNDKLHKTFYFYFVNKFKSTWVQLSSMYTITLTNSILWQVIFFCDEFKLFSEKKLVKLVFIKVQMCFFQEKTCHFHK